jgi:hypothetical protein
MSISISVILFNKWLLAFSGFPYPIALTSWHMLFCSTIGFLCVRVFKVVKSHNMTAHTYTRRVLPIGEGHMALFPRFSLRALYRLQHCPPHRLHITADLFIATCRPAVRSEPVAVKRLVPVPVSVLHPDD